MTKTKQKILFLFLVCFSIYCALAIGQSWDEEFLVNQGRITLNYLLSLGRIDVDLHLREYYSPIYYSLKFLLTQIFPISYRIEASHLINLIFSLSAIIAIKKLSKELFNEDVGNYVFLILFFYPIFFGHMAFNSKDTIVTFSHVWIFYLSIKYLKKQNIPLLPLRATVQWMALVWLILMVMAATRELHGHAGIPLVWRATSDLLV